MASREAAIKNNLNDRARKVGQFDELTTQDIDALIAFYDYSCLKCGKKPASSVDHVKPLSIGGTNTRENLQLLCVNCNKAKGDEEIDYRKGRICPDDFTAPNAQEKTYKKHDWDEIEADYIYGTLSMRELAKKHKVSERQLFGVASENDWVTKRQKNSSKIAAEIRKEIEAKNIEDGFSAVKALYLSMRRAFDDYMFDPAPEKLRALNDSVEKGMAAEGIDTQRKALTMKDWRDVARQNNQNTDELEQFFASITNGNVPKLGSGTEAEQGAGWTD